MHGDGDGDGGGTSSGGGGSGGGGSGGSGGSGGEESGGARKCAGRLVEPEWLERCLDEVVVLDVRGCVRKVIATHARAEENARDAVPLTETEYIARLDAYHEAHIPGAQFVDWTTDIAESESGYYGVLPFDEFCAAMERVGVSSERPVVVYDDGDMLFATRLWWCLVMYGHSNVAVLNGGMRRWASEARPLTDATPCTLTVYSEFAPSPESTIPSLRVDAADVLSLHNHAPSTLVLDARNAKQFDGTERRAACAGRIPSAVSIPYKTLLHPDRGGFLSRDQVRAVLQNAGVNVADLSTGKSTAVAYCNGGVASTVVLFALHCMCEVPLSALANYDLSWNEWGNKAADDPIHYPVEV